MSRLQTTIANAYHIVLGVAGLSLCVLQALVGTKMMHWSPWIIVSIASGVGAVTFLDNMKLLRSRYREAERHAARTTMQAALVVMLDLIAKGSHTDLLKLGASIFTVRRYWTRHWKVFPWYGYRLHRILRYSQACPG